MTPHRPVFGVDRDPAAVAGPGTFKHNPMLLLGPGPQGRLCRDCTHLLTYQMGTRWFKCALRPHSNSTATDHRAKWPACVRFEEDPCAR